MSYFWIPLLGLSFMALVWAISRGFRLDLDRELLVGTVRAMVQLLLMGFLLTWIFRWSSPWWLAVPILGMLAVAAANARQKAPGLPGVFWRILAALALSEGVAMLLLLGLRIIPPEAKTIIPLSGMVIGNAMVAAGLFYHRLLQARKEREDHLLTLLTLGLPGSYAYRFLALDALKGAMIPTVDALKTVGLVQLPGMMTGMILAGASPLEAVNYQILIMYAIAGTAAVTGMALYWLSPGYFLTAHHQLKEEAQDPGRS
ncbi:MAG: iron export ABC transporter permease subunit FetB [Clostridiales bacterium]|nr:iron export ABC transporter permease subunit FetB [Clostridiales bacterium]